MYSSTLGSTTTRVMEKELSYPIAQGFPMASGQTYYPNQMVRLLNDGTVTPVTASTQAVLGRVCSSSEANDTGNVRVVTPFESILHAKANGTVDEGDRLACTGFDSTTGRPIFKTAASGDYVSAIALTGGATTTDVTVGILLQPLQVAAA